MSQSFLITGASGFVGIHLVEHLLESVPKSSIFGTSFNPQDNALESLLPASNIIELNLLDASKTQDIINTIKPNFVIHLAALSSPSASFTRPAETISNNAVAQINLFESFVKSGIKPITLVIGSADQYGHVDPKRVPITESTPLNPVNPYAVSKISQDYLALQYFNSHQIPIIRFRPFNHTGERQPPSFVVPAFARQIAQIEFNQIESILKVGNLDGIRDFTDVKDIVRAYSLALTKAQPGEVYNLGSGQGISIRELLDTLIEFSDKSITVQTDPDKLRPVDEPVLICDYTKFSKATGWKPAIPLSKTLKRVLNYWRDQLKGDNL